MSSPVVSDAPVYATIGDVRINSAVAGCGFTLDRGGNRFTFFTEKAREYTFDFPRSDASHRGGVMATVVHAVPSALVKPADVVSFKVGGIDVAMSGKTYCQIGYNRFVALTSYGAVSVLSKTDGSRFSLTCTSSGPFGGFDRVASAVPRERDGIESSFTTHAQGVAVFLKPEARKEFEEFMAAMRSRGVVEEPRTPVVEFVEPDSASAKMFAKFAVACDLGDAAKCALDALMEAEKLVFASPWCPRFSLVAAHFECPDRGEAAAAEHAAKVEAAKAKCVKAVEEGAVKGLAFIPKVEASVFERVSKLASHPGFEVAASIKEAIERL